MSSTRTVGLAVSLAVLSSIGFIAALALTLDNFALLENPDAALSCDVSLLIGCSTNLNSWQGAVFGLPNPLLGIAFWAGVLTVAVALLAGAQFARWFWWLLNLGAAASLVFVVWFIAQSIYVLGVLCPWCMVTWVVTIPAFLVVTLHNLRAGNIPAPEPVRRGAAAAYSWIPLASIVLYLVVAVLAQARLNII